MNKKTITLVLNGFVTLEEYSEAMNGFASLVKGIQNQHAKKINIEWNVEQLESGSAVATIRGITDNQADEIYIEKCVNEYEHVGKASSEEDFNRIPSYAQEPIKQITSIINGNIPSIRFETEANDYSVSVNYKENIKSEVRLNIPLTYMDTVIGRVQNLYREPVYRFTLYERVKNKAVTCYLNPKDQEVMRNAWGKNVLVEGLVKINPRDGLPETIREIKDVKPYNEGKGTGWKDAIGCASGFTGNESPEKAVRRLRDG